MCAISTTKIDRIETNKSQSRKTKRKTEMYNTEKKDRKKNTRTPKKLWYVTHV